MIATACLVAIETYVGEGKHRGSAAIHVLPSTKIPPLTSAKHTVRPVSLGRGSFLSAPPENYESKISRWDAYLQTTGI
jgi:hypothetical protein